MQVVQVSRVPVPKGSNPSSSCMHISVWPQALNGEYNALLRHSKEKSGAGLRMLHKEAHVCVKMDIIMYANNPCGLECSQISIFTRIGCSHHDKFILCWSTTMPPRFQHHGQLLICVSAPPAADSSSDHNSSSPGSPLSSVSGLLIYNSI